MEMIKTGQTKNIEDYLFVENDAEVANCQLEFYLEENEIFIHSINSYKKGYGTRVVNFLKNIDGVSMITGESVPEARDFWVKMGANFYDESEFSIEA